MKRLLLAVLILSVNENVHSQTWQPMGIPEGSGVTDLVYWSGGGAVFGDKLWATTGSVNWPTGQRGGVFYSATSGTYQGVWYRVGGSAGYYIGRTLTVGQDGNLYASLWRDPAQFPADALCRFVPQAATFGLLYQAQAGDNIFSIAVKNNPHTIFGGTRNGVIRSIDNGVSFGYSNSGIPDSSWVYDIAIDSSGIMAIASSKGVFISTDNGDSWLTTTGLAPEDTAKTLMFRHTETISNSLNKSLDTEENDELYTGTHNGKLLRSFAANAYTNALLLYLFSNDEELSDIEKLGRYIIVTTWKKNNSRNVLMDSNLGGVYKSTDDGINWDQIDDGLPNESPVSALATKEINETFVEIYTGLFNDTTGGAGVYKLSLTVDVEEVNNQIPTEYNLEQNYPNPFNPSTKISWQSPVNSHHTIKVYDVLGNEVATLLNEEKPAGNYEVNFDASELSSGIYFCKIQAGSFVDTKKMILIK